MAKVSAGIHSCVNKQLLNNVRRAYIQSSERLINQLAAHNSGKKVMITIDNPNKAETNKKFIRVSSLTKWKDPKQTFVSKY